MKSFFSPKKPYVYNFLAFLVTEAIVVFLIKLEICSWVRSGMPLSSQDSSPEDRIAFTYVMAHFWGYIFIGIPVFYYAKKWLGHHTVIHKA